VEVFESDPWFMLGSTKDEKEEIRQTPVKMCRLGWAGDMGSWDLAFHRYSDGRYQPSIASTARKGAHQRRVLTALHRFTSDSNNLYGKSYWVLAGLLGSGPLSWTWFPLDF
jgi:hypothetical protein